MVGLLPSSVVRLARNSSVYSVWGLASIGTRIFILFPDKTRMNGLRKRIAFYGLCILGIVANLSVVVQSVSLKTLCFQGRFPLFDVLFLLGLSKENESRTGTGILSAHPLFSLILLA